MKYMKHMKRGGMGGGREGKGRHGGRPAKLGRSEGNGVGEGGWGGGLLGEEPTDRGGAPGPQGGHGGNKRKKPMFSVISR